MFLASCPGAAALARCMLGNLTAPTFTPVAAPADGARGTGPAEPERAVILRGGPILTMDETNPIGEALAIRGSRIVGVGSLTEVKRHYTPGTEIVDLDGHAVLPGFVEPHVHVMMSALAGAGEQVSTSVAETPDRLAELCAGTLREFAARGCTTVYDAGIGLVAGEVEHRVLDSLAHHAEAPLRIRGAFTPELAKALGVGPGAGDERYDVVGIAYWADGSIEKGTAALREPYLNREGIGTLNYEGERLQEQMRNWHRDGWQLVVHAEGDRAVEQVLGNYEAILTEDTPARGTHRIEHFTVVSDEQIAKAAELGLEVSHTINQIYSWGERFRDGVLGPERAARIHSLRRDLEHGIASSCNSGSPASPVDPCLTLRTATTRLMRDSDDVLGPFQQLKVEEALRTVTCNPARQALLGDQVGSLRSGMLADLVVLDRDPRDVAPERLHELQVLETWVDGRRQRWG
jgi:predicted amidohydrolase YtcJ